MKIVKIVNIINYGKYMEMEEFRYMINEIISAVESIKHPPGNTSFTIYPVKHANGVVPIKRQFFKSLLESRWEDEFVMEFSENPGTKTLADGICNYKNDSTLPVAIEWETGNISSSHRSINRLAWGILNEKISAGILLVASKKLAKWLTDRIGNYEELISYQELWQKWEPLTSSPHYLGIVVFEHDEEDESVSPIPKGNDGNSKLGKVSD